MSIQTIGLAAVALLAASGFWTEEDPFVGKWRLDVSRSTIVDEMRVEGLGRDKYAFNFEGGPTETIVADGTDQPGLPGTTLSVTAEDAHTLRVVRKQGGRVVVSATWTLSKDGRILRDAFTSLQPDDSMMKVDYVYRRVAGTSGFAGTWESSTPPTGLKLELAIQAHGNLGLSFVSPGSDKNVTFDGRDHAVQGAKDGLILAGRRQGQRALKFTESSGGKITRSREFTLSPDGRTLTETLHTAGQMTPDVLVFERE
jgi:hypothetical protein